MLVVLRNTTFIYVSVIGDDGVSNRPSITTHRPDHGLCIAPCIGGLYGLLDFRYSVGQHSKSSFPSPLVGEDHVCANHVNTQLGLVLRSYHMYGIV